MDSITKVKKYKRGYKVYKGVYYNNNTSDDMIRILDNLRENKKRVQFRFGNTKTGEDWGEVNDIMGHIGTSTGEVKIPLLIHNARSMGGGGLLTGNIVKIMESKRAKLKRPIYQNPKYHIKDSITKQSVWMEKRFKQLGVIN
jgi:hypothetical protein